jgi:hypothetical protein
MTALPEQPPQPPDLVGNKFLRSIGPALGMALWGAVCGYFVERAVDAGDAARTGAVAAAALLAVCGSALAFAEGRRHGLAEGLGRALLEAISSTWRGLWLGGLIGGAFAAGGFWVLFWVFAALAAGGAVGFLIARFRRIPELVGRLNLALSFALLAGFVVSGWLGARSNPAQAAALAESIRESPVFGPAAGWYWYLGCSLPLVVGAIVWWAVSPREAKDKGQSLGWSLAALVFTAALAGGLGAAAGAGAQWLGGQLVFGGVLTPTLGKGLGAVVALVFWGVKRNPEPAVSTVSLKERILGTVAALLEEKKAPEETSPPALAETR